MKTIKGETYGAVDDDEYVDYGLIGNKIHYYAYRQRHSPKVKKSYDTAHSAYLALLRGTFFTHRNLRNLFYICECPRCDKFHLIPRKVVRENREIGQYIVHNVDKYGSHLLFFNLIYLYNIAFIIIFADRLKT